VVHLQAGKISTAGRQINYTIPMPLICSQLSAATTYPLKMTLTLMDSQSELCQDISC
jgi:hypothetical protein